MNKITEFYAKAIADESTKTRLGEILDGKAINNADDLQLEKIGVLAKELGFEITVEEAKAYLNGDNSELDDNELEAVAGGTCGPKETPFPKMICDMPGNVCIGGGSINPKIKLN